MPVRRGSVGVFENRADVIARQVEVIRTAYGVPHIYADNFRALGYALGYLQTEDYGERVPIGLLRSRGELARYQGRTALESDIENRPAYSRAIEVYDQLSTDTRNVYEGFALGVGRYVELHPEQFEEWMPSEFTGYDVAASYFYRPIRQEIRRWQRRLAGGADTDADEDPGDRTDGQSGSSAWALAGSRTTSGVPILLRNPHLDWEAGYWEVHVVVPGRLDFYGDFRIGGPLGIIGGFNRNLGFATTNNDVAGSEVYALELDDVQPDHYLFDGALHPVESRPVTLLVREGDGYVTETRVRLRTHLGPVVHRDQTRIYVLRAARDGSFRGGEQFLRLIQARDFEEWLDAMRLRAHPVSNFVYADRQDNIFYVWNAAIPVRPHAPGGLNPVPVSRSGQVWTALHELEDLPQLLNPEGGYVRNENDAPWLTNLNAPLDPSDYPAYFEAPSLGLRSQHAIDLVESSERLSLEDVVRLKHSYRMLLAERVKGDLVSAVRSAFPGSDSSHSEVLDAIGLIERWDNTVAPDSRGAVLFETWWRFYEDALDGRGPYAEEWTADRPIETPRGLADPPLAAQAFFEALSVAADRWEAWDVAWGEVHRVRRGEVDLPVGGCEGELGCFRVLAFEDESDGRRRVSGGDGWVLAVEFTDPPRARSVLGYGQSPKPESLHFADQAALFARGEMKPVAFTREDVERQAVRRYHPGVDETQ